MLTNIRLLEVVSKERKRTFISTGMSTIKEIDTAVKIFKKINVILYSCILSQVTRLQKKI